MRRPTRISPRLLSAAFAAVLAPTVQAEARTFQSSAGPLKVVTVARGLDHPWSVAFLPSGRMLVTERPGRLRIVTRNGGVGAPVRGVPRVAARGQGGLLDVVADPDFARNRTIFFSYSEPGRGGAGTAVARARLDGNALTDLKIVFRMAPKSRGGRHFGSRIVIARDGALFVTLGECGERRPHPGHEHPSRPGHPHRQGRFGSERQSFRRPQGVSPGNLVLRPSQPARRGAASGDRQAVDSRAWRARRRRGEHSRARPQLRLADHRLRAALLGRQNRRRDPTKPASNSRSITGIRRSRLRAWPS